MPKINRETKARPLVNGDSWWLPQPRKGFTAICAKLFEVDEPPTAIVGIAWQQQAAWDKKKAS